MCTHINEKCGTELEALTSKLKNPRLIIYNTPEDMTSGNVVEAIVAQNSELGLCESDIIAKFMFEDRRKNTNLVVEVKAEVRRKIINKKLKIGWNICNWDDYVRVTRCYNCSKFNHTSKYCNGNLTCPNCSQSHKLSECTSRKDQYQCVNCINYNKFNTNAPVPQNHSSLDKSCKCYQSALRKYVASIEY